MQNVTINITYSILHITWAHTFSNTSITLIGNYKMLAKYRPITRPCTSYLCTVKECLCQNIIKVYQSEPTQWKQQLRTRTHSQNKSRTFHTSTRIQTRYKNRRAGTYLVGRFLASSLLSPSSHWFPPQISGSHQCCCQEPEGLYTWGKSRTMKNEAMLSLSLPTATCYPNYCFHSYHYQ